jgi:superfamily II DNA or RNA helicase
MSIKLRPYQQTLVDGIREAWTRVRSVLAVLPTGGDGASAAVVHRKEIVGQISCSLAQLDVKHRIVAPPATVAVIRRKHLKRFGRSFIDPHARCGVISVQTLTSKSSQKDTALQGWLRQVTLAVFDEGHHYVKSGLWGRAVEAFSAARLLFVTATPQRADGQGLGSHADGFCDEMVEGPSTQWLIEKGYLSKFRYFAPDTDLDVTGLATPSGDFTPKALRSRVVESHLVGDVTQHWRRFAEGKRTIVFAPDVETAHEIASAFRAKGVAAVALSGKTDQAERDRELERFEAGEVTVLVNCALFDEGFDVPAVECVLLASPTMSLSKFLQMIGRGLRTLEGKTEAIVIDMVRNWERGHGMPNWPRQWTLDAREKGTRSTVSDTKPQRVCLECTQPYSAFLKACTWCGAVHVPPERSTPEQVGGDLTELDVEGMAALFAKIDKAGMADDEYAADQAARHIPLIGRGADMKRHRAAKYRRGVLHELVAWWVGMQSDRELGEIHRRFYVRFGIDIGLAFTLSATDTDALIATITTKFTEDLT